MFHATHLAGFGAFNAQASGLVKSIQPFEITIAVSATSNTATITSVDTSKSVIFFGGCTTTNGSSAYRESMGRAELTNGTTVTVYRDTSSASHTLIVRGTVVEFEPWAVVSVQAGTVSIASGATSSTATISSVTTTRTALFYLGMTVSTSTTSPQSVFSRIDLTNATTVTANRASSSSAGVTIGYCAVEFASGAVASIQPRSVTLSVSATSSTDTISSVTTGNSLLLYNGATSASSALNVFLYALELTGATQVTLSRNSSSSTSRTINYTVLEFAAGYVTSAQRGRQAVSSATSADATISSVNTAKAVCNWVGFSADGSSTDERLASAKLQSATTMRAQKGTGGISSATVGWEVMEFV